MPLTHKFIDELNLLEQSQIFCNQKISSKSKILVIGTFNPCDDSCDKPNDATWFYGRQRNWFWKYLPECLTGQNLHPSENQTRENWQKFCIENKIVIVDLVKEIDHDQILEDFKDERLDNRINNRIDNVTIFDFAVAFNNISFEKVIYTRKGWSPAIDNKILKLIQIKCNVNNILLQNNIINNLNQIKYCPAPWQRRQTTQNQWCNAING